MDAVSNQNNKSDSAKRLVTSSLHPRVYGLLMGLTLWFVLWVWSFIGAGETDYLLFIVSGFIAIVVALQVQTQVSEWPTDVRFGSKADIASIKRDVRLRGHLTPRPQCPLHT